MSVIRKTKPTLVENPNDPNVRDPEHKHELGGTLGMTIGGVATGIAAGVGAGAAIGGAAGPIGAVLGAAVGGALGGSAGESIAREINPTAEEKYWSENYKTRPYVADNQNYDSYRSAYRYGVDSYAQYPNREFTDIEPSIRNNWGAARGDSPLEWDEARGAARDAFQRLKDTPRKD